jgi:hypothetical protein
MSRILIFVFILALVAWRPAVSAGVVPEQESTEAEQPKAGELVLPEELKGTEDGGEKKCMTVCARWGEECILVNKGAGGMERKCRRTCLEFAEECF